MSQPVDLTNLRGMTDGDKDMEKALFEEFFSSFEKGISALQASCNDNTHEVWRKESHALKGIALNLGAGTLGGLCKQGQNDYLAGADAKNLLLLSIREEYEKVRQFLLTTIASG